MASKVITNSDWSGPGALVRSFLADDNGATAIEYSLIIALIFLAIVASLKTYSENTNNIYNEITDAVTNS